MNLPLLDGCFLIDNSTIEKFKCPRAFEYSEVLRKSSCDAKAGANFGSTIHRGLETRYNLVGSGKVDNATTECIKQNMQEWQEANPQPVGDFRNFNHSCKMMDVYNTIYPSEQFEILKAPLTGKPIIEASFALPFGKVQDVPIIYCGKIDLGIKDHNGIWSFDHKTAFQFGDSFDKQMQMDGGQLGYCWALGQTLGIKPNGYIIDAIRVRRPKVQDEFSDISCIDRTDFKRIPFYVTDAMLEEWRQDVLTIITDIFSCYDRSYFPRHRWQCVSKYGACEFYDVCSTSKDSRPIILNSVLFQENTWTSGLKLEKHENKT